MRVDCTTAVLTAFPDIDDTLWDIAVHAKSLDHDIKLTGLRVRVIKSRYPMHWYGWAHPLEESRLYGSKLIHPAGRIDLGIGVEVDRESIICLMAHELRHIGQYHRGRQMYGYLTTQHMKESGIERDCYEFEEQVAKSFGVSCKGYKACTVRADCARS